MRLSRFIHFSGTWAKAFHIACALLVTPMLSATSKGQSEGKSTGSKCLEQQESCLREKMRATFQHYHNFLVHFGNSEYGSATVAYSNILRGIRSAYHQRKILHQMKRDLPHENNSFSDPAKELTQESVSDTAGNGQAQSAANGQAQSAANGQAQSAANGQARTDLTMSK